jgi:hypothetical protein
LIGGGGNAIAGVGGWSLVHGEDRVGARDVSGRVGDLAVEGVAVVAGATDAIV